MLPTREALIESAARRFVAAAAEAIEASGRFVVALSGGSTPQGLYALLATDAYASRVDWSRVHVLWGDERCVPPDDPASNYRMARLALLDHVPLAAGNVHRIAGESDPAEAASAYERELRRLFGCPTGPPPLAPGARFDLVLLGLGEDGHTASLFPGSKAVRETGRWAIAERVAGVPRTRVTLTPPVINAAAEVLFLVSGREKAAMLHRALDGPWRRHALPAQAIVPAAGRLRWLADAEAAADLDREAGTP
ncbi:MAG TPA: 6-phosphogluconolactonase [Thermoanaerobaculia bacterium]